MDREDAAGAANREDAAGPADTAGPVDAVSAADYEDPAAAANSEDTAAAADSEDTADVLAATVDADIFETLVQDFNCSTAPGQERSIPLGQPHVTGSPPSDPVPLPPASVHIKHCNSETLASLTLIVDHFPHGSPGAPIPGAHQGLHIYQSTQDSFGECLWAPFRSERDWEIARWAKTRGATSSALAELLAIPKVCAQFLLLFHVTKAIWKVVDDLGLSYSTPKDLNGIIDDLLPGRPPFQCQDLVIAGDTFQFYSRDLLQCIRTLYGDPEFAQDLVFVPERHYTDLERKSRVYNEMHTGDWWWAVQVCSLILSPLKC